MTTNFLASATSLSNRDLLARLPQLAANERTATAELVAYLVALDMRPDVYAAEGYGSLFAYCTRALRLSEDAACTRIAAVSACRRFPSILALLASGDLTLTAVRRVGPHLTRENCDAVLARALNRTRSELDELVAELNPRPDAAPAVRRVAARAIDVSPLVRPAQSLLPVSGGSAVLEPPISPRGAVSTAAPPARPGPTEQSSAPARYRMHFTIGQDAYEKFRRLQALLRREIPSGDPGIIFERFVDAALDKVERSKVGKAAKPRKRTRIRSGTDNPAAVVASGRHIPNDVKREVWNRDGGRCAFVARDGNRCSERAYLEFHHVRAYALGGAATVDNISLRCRRHNQHEAQMIFGPPGAPAGVHLTALP